MPSINAKKLKIFEFMMSVLVILVHSLSNVTFLKDVITTYIQPISVVPFFIISGFLFFRNIYSTQDVVRKISTRIHTLLIPYILWNLIYYIIYVVCRKSVYFRIDDMLDAVLTYIYNPTFWFLYQLIILTLITPLIFYLLKDKKVAKVTFIAVAVLILIGGDVPYINEDAFVYYFFGAYIARYRSQWFYDIKKRHVSLYSLVLAIGAYFVCIALFKLSVYSMYIYNLGILMTICQRICVAIVLYTGIDYVCRYNKVMPYMEHNFFTYAIHYIIIRFINSVTKMFTIFHMDVMMQNIIELIVFLVAPIVVIAISHFLYKLMYKKCHKVLMTLTGGR